MKEISKKRAIRALYNMYVQFSSNEESEDDYKDWLWEMDIIELDNNNDFPDDVPSIFELFVAAGIKPHDIEKYTDLKSPIIKTEI